MRASQWFATQSFNGRLPEATVSSCGYLNVPAEHHVHLCTTCDKEYPCTSVHRRIDGTPDTPPRATKHCGDCAGLL